MDSSPEEIYYVDGSRVIPSSADSAKVPVHPRQALDDILPLAPNLAHLSRPIFSTIHLDISIGVAKGNFSDLHSLTGQNSDFFVPISFNIDVPILEVPDLSIVSGFGFAIGGAGGGSLAGFSSMLLWKLSPNSAFTPIVGFGASENSYSYSSDSVDISASAVSPTLLLGIEVNPSMLDILLSIPLRPSLKTTFESRSYAVEPTGIRLSLLVAL
jgi:hypothetical protein